MTLSLNQLLSTTSRRQNSKKKNLKAEMGQPAIHQINTISEQGNGITAATHLHPSVLSAPTHPSILHPAYPSEYHLPKTQQGTAVYRVVSLREKQLERLRCPGPDPNPPIYKQAGRQVGLRQPSLE